MRSAALMKCDLKVRETSVRKLLLVAINGALAALVVGCTAGSQDAQQSFRAEISASSSLDASRSAESAAIASSSASASSASSASRSSASAANASRASEASRAFSSAMESSTSNPGLSDVEYFQFGIDQYGDGQSTISTQEIVGLGKTYCIIYTPSQGGDNVSQFAAGAALFIKAGVSPADTAVTTQLAVELFSPKEKPYFDSVKKSLGGN